MSLRDINIDFPLNVLLGQESSSVQHKNEEQSQQRKRNKKDDIYLQEEATNLENEESNFEYVYLGNIPYHFKSSDLRYYFVDVIEKGFFKCFHYRHRPETQQIIDTSSTPEKVVKSHQKPDFSLDSLKDNITTKSCCCIIKCTKKNSESLIQKYNGREWRSATFKFTKTRVNIRILRFPSSTNTTNEIFQTKREIKMVNHLNDQELSLQDIKGLLEMNPPADVMPNGNVGTPTKHFQKMISECRLPSSVIKKLGIVFPKQRKNRQYTSVHHDYYETSRNIDQNISGISNEDNDNEERTNNTSENDKDDEAEEWDRYEALHDDVDNQGRPKERLFEEDLEVKWEKGGSGLVFYTDAYFWNERKGKDFDEDTVDDWDVDYSIYYEDDAGDKPAKDQLKMRLEKRRRQGKVDGPVKYSDIRRSKKRSANVGFAEFEKHTTAFGSRILKQQGWRHGDGVGSCKQGIKEPVNIEGNTSKIGLGYYGEKLDRTVSLKREAEKDVYISTIYDEKDGEHMDTMRFHGLDLLKYRTPKVEFKKP